MYHERIPDNYHLLVLNRPLCQTFGAGLYTVIVGKFGDTDSTNGFVKAVEVPYQLDCPLTLGKNLWENGEPDTFSVAVDGTTVTVTRTDRATAWGMNLQFTCAIKGT